MNAGRTIVKAAAAIVVVAVLTGFFYVLQVGFTPAVTAVPNPLQGAATHYQPAPTPTPPLSGPSETEPLESAVTPGKPSEPVVTTQPTPTTTSVAPKYTSGPTGTHYATAVLAVRPAPEADGTHDIKVGTEVELSGRVAGDTAELSDGTWVTAKYVSKSEPAPQPTVTPTAASTASASPTSVPTTPESEVSDPPASEPEEPDPATSQAVRCTYVWSQALAILPAPAGTSMVCTETSSGSPGETEVKWTVNADGTRTVTHLESRLDPPALELADDKITSVAVHELAHAWHDAGSADAQEAHYAALGTTESDYNAGSYYNRPSERFAQAAAVYLAGANWGSYQTLDQATFNAAMAALN